MPIERETEYLHSYIRGVYAKRDLKEGDILTEQDIYLAIPLQKGQLSCRELMLGRWGHTILKGLASDQPIMIDAIDTPYAGNDELKKIIYDRGI
jgi:N-acetylneuraminate synthase